MKGIGSPPLENALLYSNFQSQLGLDIFGTSHTSLNLYKNNIYHYRSILQPNALPQKCLPPGYTRLTYNPPSPPIPPKPPSHASHAT